jgi:hypothetical protein
MKKHRFTLDLPSSMTATQASREGEKHIEHANVADYACHGAKPSPEPGMRRWSYSYSYGF